MGYYEDVMAKGTPGQQPTDPFNPPRPKKQPWFDLEDIALAVPRGVVGAAKGAYNLLDTVGMDVLPDWNENPLGKSKSIIGGFIEGAAHFTAGFIPFGGGLGLAGVLAKGATTLSKVGRVAAASGLAGFTVFEGHEARLSDLVERNPSLSNPLTAFLASDGNDPELLGRLKNAIEQAGMGAAAEGLILGVKAVWAGNRVKADILAKGGTVDEAAKGADAAAAEVAPPEKMIQLMRDAEGMSPEDILGSTGEHILPDSMRMRLHKSAAFTAEEHAAVAAEAKARYPNLSQREAEAKMLLDDGRANVEKAERGDRRLQEAGKPPEGMPERRAPKPVPAEAPITAPEAPKGPPIEGVDATPAQARRAPILRRLGLDDEKIKKFTAAYEVKGQKIEDVLGPGAGLPGETAFDPKKLSSADRLEMGLLASDLPMQNFQSSDAANVLIRTVEELFRTEAAADFKALAPTTIKKIMEDAAVKNAEMLGIRDTGAYYAATQVRAGRTVDAMQDTLTTVVSDQAILKLSSQRVAKIMQQGSLIRKGEGPRGVSIEKNAAEFGEALQHMAGMRAAVRGEKALAGRILRVMKEESKVGDVELPPELLKLADDPVRLQQTLEDMGGVEAVMKQMEKYQKAWDLAGDGGGHAALHKLNQGTWGRKILDMTTEFFMGSVLSSPQTWVINAASPGLASVFLPLERALGSAVIRGADGRLTSAAVLAGQQPIIRESFAQIAATRRAFMDSFRMLRDSGWNPESRLSGAGIFDKGPHKPAITAQNLGMLPDSPQAAMTNWLGSVTRFPLKVLGGTDVVMKNTIYRASAFARLQTEAMELGITIPAEIVAHAESRLQRLVGDGQAYTQKAVLERGVAAAKAAGVTDPEVMQKFVTDYFHGPAGFDQKLATLSAELIKGAEVATFTNRAAAGTVQSTVLNVVGRHPVLKLNAPFVNTPMNLLKGAAQRGDFVSVSRYVVGRVLGRKWPKMMPEITETSSRFLQDMHSGDPRQAADAIGRVTVGMGAAVTFTQMAFDGLITGRGPSDPTERQALIDTGWQPYSFHIGDIYISYQRLDPFATFIGTSADMVEYMNREEDVDDEDHATAISGLAIGMANNMTNKSYLTGFANLIGALQAPEEKLPTFFRRQVAAFVPNILGTAGYGFPQDPNLREVRSFTDAIMAKIPGLSNNLPPRRNILGEPLERPMAVGGEDPLVHTGVNLWDPIKYSRVKDDVVRTELAALGHSWEPPKRRVNGLDLMEVPAGKTTAYDRWQELQGTVLIGGDALKAALRREIKSPEYRKLTAESVDGLESPRVGRLNRIIGDYRAAAWKKLMRELPDLKQHNTAFVANRHRVRAGLPAAIIPGL